MHCRNFRILMFLFLVFFSFFRAPALAATHTVTNTSDAGPGSLLQAIATAGAYDTIVFSLDYPATITTTGLLIIDKSLSIIGPGAEELTVRTTGTNSVLKIDGASPYVGISGLTITGGNATAGYGGGIYVKTGELTLMDSKVTGNFAKSGGGGIYVDQGSLYAIDTEITNNSTGTTLLSHGGGIHVTINGALYLDRVTISDNFTSLATGIYGGGIYLACPGTVTIKNSTIARNQTGSYGGGICYQSFDSLSKQLIMTDCVIMENTANVSSGGGLWIKDPGLEMTRCHVSGNVANDYGGGVYAQPAVPAAVLFNDCSFGDNLTVRYNGAGAWLKGESHIHGCCFQNNHASGGGGGLQIASAWGTIKNSTFHGNLAGDAGGGGLSISSVATPNQVSLSFVTVTGNSGGGIYVGIPTVNTGDVILKSCVVAENMDSSDPLTDQAYADLSAGNFMSLGYNFIGRKGEDTIGFTNGVNNDRVGGATALDPRLMGLADNGGPTLSRVPMAGSPLINAGGPALDAAGAAVTVDQRGEERPNGPACDIGAVETLSPPSIVPVLMMLLE